MKRWTPLRKFDVINPILSGRSSYAQASADVGVSEDELRDWVERYKRLGLAGLKLTIRQIDRPTYSPLAQTRLQNKWARRINETPPGLTKTQFCKLWDCGIQAAENWAGAFGYAFALPSSAHSRHTIRGWGARSKYAKALA